MPKSCKLFGCHKNDSEELTAGPEPIRTPVGSCPTTPRAERTSHQSFSTRPTSSNQDHTRSQSGSTQVSFGTTLSSPGSLGHRASKKFSLLADQISQRGSGIFTNLPQSPSSSFTVRRPSENDYEMKLPDITTATCDSTGCRPVSRIIADCIVTKLCAFPITDALRDEIDELVRKADGWDEALAKCIHHQLLRLLRAHADDPDAWPLGDEIRTAFTAATIAFDALNDQSQDLSFRHPVYAQVITLGVLSQVLPGVVFYLGFQDYGVVPSSWASQWRGHFNHIVSTGSMLKYLRTFGTLHGQQQVRE